MLTKRTIDLFEVSNYVLSHNLKPLLVNDAASRKIEKVIKNFVRNASGRMSEMFSRWRNANRIMGLHESITNDKKSMLIENLERVLNYSHNARAREVLSKFKKNAAIRTITTKFINKLLDSSHGRIFVLFGRWKSLPEPKLSDINSIAFAFERKLHNFANKNIRKGFDPLKSSYLNGEARKKRCIIVLMKNSLSSEQRLINKWHQLAQD